MKKREPVDLSNSTAERHDARPEWLKGVYAGDGETPCPDPLVYEQLDRYKKNDVEYISPSLRNIALILDFDPRWASKIEFDEFHRKVLVHGASCEDSDETEINLWLVDHYDLNVPTLKVHEALVAIAKRHAFHPVRSYLESLSWDGRPRLEHFPFTYLGTPYSPIVSELFYRWAVSAVARIMRPGCKVDTCLILVGEQGTKKSSAFAELATRPWFSDTPVNLGSKDAFEQLAGVWIYELAELDSVRRAETSATKAFISAPVDHYRPSYGRCVITVERQCVFVGSTNEQEFLSDPTGSRRFWPVRTSITGPILLERIAQDRDQLWAEAVCLYNSAVPWWLDVASERELAALSETYQQHESWDDPVRTWLQGRYNVTVFDILTGALEIEKGRINRADQMRVASILRRLAWTKERRGTGVNRSWIWNPPDPNAPLPTLFEPPVQDDRPPVQDAGLDSPCPAGPVEQPPDDGFPQ